MTDPHGNVVQLTDESGAVIKTYEYDSFGNEVNPDRKDENPFRYCGEYYDKETEEIYLRARYYQPNVGRFLTRDSYTGESDEPLSLHLYTYCENDGINSVDPSGHKKYAKEEPLAGLSVWLDKYINSDLGKENKKVIQVQNSKNKKVKNKKKINTPLYNKHKVLLKKVKSNNLFNSTLNKFGKKYTKNKKKYKNISKRTKLPPQLIAAIHYRESSCNFKTYLQDIRMAYAYKELLHTDHTISSIALDNGFASSRAFSREFVKRYGILPGRVERQNHKNVKKVL